MDQRCFLSFRFEVVDRFDDFDDLCGRSDVFDDLVHAFVGHRAFAQGLHGGGRRVDTAYGEDRSRT